MNEKNNKRTIFGWSMYDWAKSAYETTILGAVLPVYFVSVIVPEEGFEFRGNVYTGAEVWGFAIGSALFIFFLIMPTIGAIADMSGNRMRFFKVFAFGGAIFASTFYFANSGDVLFTLGIYFLAQLGATGSNVFYDSVLKDITTDDTIDSVSARGYALGYLGGGTDLILSFVIILLGPDMLGIDTGLASKIAITKSGLWWLIFSVFSFSRMDIVETKSGNVSIVSAYSRNFTTLKKISKFPFLLYFLISYIFFWDGLQTLINMSAVFFTEVLLLDQTQVLIVFLVVQFVAYFGAKLAGNLATKIGQKNVLYYTMFLLFIVGNAAYFVPEKQLVPVIVMGIVTAMGMGGLQSVSRSVYAAMLPKGAEGEFMGFFSVLSRFSAIWGPLIYAYVSASTGNPRLSLPVITSFFLIGYLLLRNVDMDKRISEEEWNAS
ncbi:MFS transporter [Acidimicrobiaceae bacterium]|nr:MFS transporter [Acidimicrobiaceae bacterium]